MLCNEDAGISRSHYLRLMALGTIDLALWLPLSLTFLIIDLSNMKLEPYSSWRHVHGDFDRVLFVPITEFTRGNNSVYVLAELGRWIGPALALNFFIFFGIKPEIWSFYLKSLKHVKKTFNRHSQQTASQNVPVQTMSVDLIHAPKSP